MQKGLSIEASVRMDEHAERFVHRGECAHGRACRKACPWRRVCAWMNMQKGEASVRIRLLVFLAVQLT